MSMISGQIDKLRNAAEFYDGSQAANLMRDAADTIWQLRDDLQRANAENAKLRESVKRLMTQRDERLARAETDNAELRELAAKMAEALRVGGEWCDRECIVVFGCDGMDECPIANELRELEVEVGG